MSGAPANCFDCPDLALSPDCPPEGIKIRERCCRDDYLDARQAGHFEAGWPGLSAGRKMMDEFAAVADQGLEAKPARAAGNRHQRRAKAAKKK